MLDRLLILIDESVINLKIFKVYQYVDCVSRALNITHYYKKILIMTKNNNKLIDK